MVKQFSRANVVSLSFSAVCSQHLFHFTRRNVRLGPESSHLNLMITAWCPQQEAKHNTGLCTISLKKAHTHLPTMVHSHARPLNGSVVQRAGSVNYKASRWYAPKLDCLVRYAEPSFYIYHSPS